jgi:hypothetical protein
LTHESSSCGRPMRRRVLSLLQVDTTACTPLHRSEGYPRVAVKNQTPCWLTDQLLTLT